MIQGASLFNQLLQHFPRAESAALGENALGENGSALKTGLKTGQPAELLKT